MVAVGVLLLFEQTDGDPVVCVNWDDAQAYVAWLSRETGEAYRSTKRVGVGIRGTSRVPRYQVCHWGNDDSRL